VNICLYGASSNEIDKNYIESAEKVGELIAERGHTLIFGGGARGIMGGAARGAHSRSGKINGIAPSFFNVDGILFEHCTELIYTETMRERKRLMEEMADAFIVMPGGVGTLEEFLEIFTLKQLARHSKPIALFNQNGYYDDIIKLFSKAIREKFMNEKCRELCAFFTDIVEMLEYIEQYRGTLEDIMRMKNI